MIFLIFLLAVLAAIDNFVAPTSVWQTFDFKTEVTLCFFWLSDEPVSILPAFYDQQFFIIQFQFR